MNTRWQCALVTLLLACGSAVAQTPIQCSVTTDRPRYRSTWPVHIGIIGRNPTDQDITLTFGTSQQAAYIMDRQSTPSPIVMPVITHRTIPAQGYSVWDMQHTGGLSYGKHEVVGRIVGYGESSPATFEIVKPVIPKADFRVDFDTFFDDLGRPAKLSDFSPWGIDFRGLGGSTPTLAERDGQWFAQAGSTTDRSNTNLVVKFRMPVLAASARVCADVNAKVTLIAKDAQGLVLDSVISDPILRYHEFAAPISVRSNKPIASLEFWAPRYNSELAIDHLAIVVPEPCSAIALGLAATILLSRRLTPRPRPTPHPC